MSENQNLAIENARIWSDGLDGFAEFAAVRDGRFVHVGDRDESFIDSETQRIDAGGRVVAPGFIDSHAHMLQGGLTLGWLDMRGAQSRDEFVRLVRDYAAAAADAIRPGSEDQWLRGFAWSTGDWGRPESPRKEWIDGVTGDRPAFLTQMDLHSALVNSAALRRAGVTRAGPADPEGGLIERDPETGEPTGILRESAIGLIRAGLPAPTLDEQVGALRRAMNEAARFGVTAVADIPFPGELNAYAALARSGESSLTRLFLYPIAKEWSAIIDEIRAFPARSNSITIAGLKDFLDGALGSRTAFMREPYCESRGAADQSTRGLLMDGIADGRFLRNTRIAARERLQPMAHAIGDEANHLLLNWYESTFNGDSRLRPRAEHAQSLLADDIERFAALGVIASMQPLHRVYDASTIEAALGPARAPLAYAWKRLMSAGATVVFGSDWPVVSMNPWRGVDAAVTGRAMDGGFWRPEDSIAIEEAMRCYTSRAAYALFAERDLGRIAPGCLADFVILNESPFKEGIDLRTVEPVATYVGGRPVFER